MHGCMGSPDAGPGFSPSSASPRCKQRLVVVGRASLALRHPDTLIGKLAALCKQHALVVPEGNLPL